ncbi:alpha-amylase family glycosyl hydrolase [Paractinoplanes durhamensis]|uniref:alpha-amylase family glycosyl hydrolase n=1 Tax=Paractinoplanes durhamensis TaxID=113563 RepID=UPI0036409493
MDLSDDLDPAYDPAEGSHVEDGVVEHPTAEDFGHARALPADATWFQRAVFYEVLVRAFYDSSSDGSGDLRGLIERLDYLQWLGVDCLWLPPFYDSPLRDGGYDIRDFYKVLPEFGTVEDFVALLDAAHKRGIRVITDLVMNHTSDQHAWFQESRRDPDGPYGDFYVWSDTSDKYQDARVIFVDTEESNWTFDPVRRQFFWHRFFSHQPDLNYDNPAVQEAMLDCLRFWLDIGIDGFRLDAVPYLYEREGTNGENLPETHSFLKHCRKVIDDEFPGRVLLAEANQWPADVVEYFGDPKTGGDECHMAFHFPLMPRIFMAVRRESRFPISEILAQTPAIPDNCQWGIFLRNHDELTLEMVTDEERDYMYSEYAKDPRMKANVGIRRRLAPCWRTTAIRSSCSPRCCCRCPVRRCCTTATRSAWATTSGSVTATACAPRCSGRPTATPASPPPTPAGSTSRPTRTRCTGTRRSTWRPSGTAPRRCSTGPGRCSRSAAGTTHSPSAPSVSWADRTRRCSPTCARTATTSSSA